MPSIAYRFEELPSFWRGDMRAGMHDGTAEIAILSDGEWAVRTIYLDCHNGKCGKEAEGKPIELSRAYDGPLWDALCNSLERFHHDHIQDQINEAVSSWREPSRMTFQTPERV